MAEGHLWPSTRPACGGEGAAVIAFYGQLTPGQQQTFYRETLPQNPRGGRGS